MNGVKLRRAESKDVPAVARLFARSCLVCLPFLRVLHSPAEDLAFFAAALDKGRITLAEQEGRLLGFAAESLGWIDHLYLEPDARGRGIGRLLARDVQGRNDRLQLWCFAQNLAALRFYASLGFLEVRRTERDNEQGLPDVLLGWRRA